MVWVLSPCCTLNEDSGTGCTQCECDDVARGTAIAASDLGYSVHTFAIGESFFKLGFTELHFNRQLPLVGSSLALVAALGAAATNTPPPPMPPSPTTPAHFASTHTYVTAYLAIAPRSGGG